MLGKPVQISALEENIFYHLSAAAKLGESELQGELSAASLATKSYHIQKAAEAAEVAGWEKQKIATKLWSYVESENYNISRRLIQIVCEPLGYTDSTFQHGNQNGETISPKIVPTSYEQENAVLITLFNTLKSSLDSKIKKLKTVSFWSRIDADTKDELIYLLNKAIVNTEAEWDGRQDVSERTYWVLFIASMLETIEKATEAYITQVKDWMVLTGKQYTKLAHGRTTIVFPLFEPLTQDNAIRLGYLGIQCANPTCRCYRVRDAVEVGLTPLAVCFKCHTEFEKPVPLKFPVTERKELPVIDASGTT